jgi:V/A-type H+-transporting ATPase subunit I
MFQPAPMKRALLAVPRTRLDAALEVVASLGVLHLLDLSEREEWALGLRPCAAEDRRRQCQEALRQIDALARFFRLRPVPTGAELPDFDTVTRQCGAWTAEMEGIASARSRLREELEQLEQGQRARAALGPLGPDLDEMRRMRFLHAASGWVAASDLARLEEALAHVSHRVVVAAARSTERLIVAFVPARAADVLERALRTIGCVRLDLPDAAPSGAPAPEARLAEVRAALAVLDERSERARLELAGPLAAGRATVECAMVLTEARAFAGRSESVVFLAGWLPADRVEPVRAAVGDATGGRYHLRIDDPLAIDSVRSGSESVPILFRNPALLRPFERLTAGYGSPRWGEIEPTPLVAAAFWLMFGFMFGDVGHGAVLAGVGFWIFRRLGRHRDFGVILMECGIASLAFGLAYGSVFGSERWLPALWFHPMQDVPRLLQAGVRFGLLLMGLSFGLGVLNAGLRRDWSGALFGSHGLLAAFAYWTAAALALRWLATGSLGVGIGLATALVGVPLALLWLRRVASELRPAQGAGERRSPLAALLAGSVELVDVVVRSVANTVSFVRLSAFAVSHAGLLLAVFALAETLEGVRLAGLWQVAVLVAGNAVVVALEGLIVSIQSVRLVYYEFFSHFHEGTGLPYRPLRLRARAAEEVVT